MEEFEIVLSSPFTWKPAKICKLWNDFHNLINHQFENGKRVTDPDILAFRERLKAAALEAKVLGPTDNWRKVLGDKHFELVTRTEVNVQTWWETSVVCLLRIIRNKHEHRDGISDPERVDLGWFLRRKGKYKLEDKLFASYWMSKFPKLVPFLWSQFGSFRASCRQYYPSTLEYDMDRLNFGLVDFVKQLEDACCHQLDSGYLEERFQCAAPTCSIELRTLSGDLLGRVLDGGSILELIVSPKQMKIIWDENSKTVMEYKMESALPNETKRGKSGAIKYIFVSGSDKVNENAVFNQHSNDTVSKSKIVIFATKDAVEGIVTKFEKDTACYGRSPINWLDVSECKRKEIECSDDFVVTIQSCEIFVKDVLPGDKILRDEMLTKLEGRVLNQFLRNSKLCAFTTYEIPDVDEFYRERRLYNLEKLHQIVFQTKPNEKDVLIVLKNPSDKNPPLPTDAKISRLDSIFPKFTLTSQLNIVNVADSETKYLEESFKTFQERKDAYISKNFHFFRYLGDEIFKWVATYGSVASVESQFIKAAKKAEIMTESKFLTRLKSRKSTKRLIFVADQPGMGKSQVLVNLAGKMLRNGKGKNIVMLFSMCQFVDIFQKNCDGNEDSGQVLKAVIKTITDLTCSGKFEEALVTQMLNESSSKIRIEIMLDGLDEVKSELGDEATKILQAFHSNPTLPVRVWVTLRDHMLGFIQKEFNTLGFRLDPLNENEQIRLLTDLWNKKCGSYPKNSRICGSLRQFAGKCIENCLSSGSAEVAGIPLQCRMIAEIFESQVLNLDFSVEKIVHFDLIDLYEKLMERKLEVYIREKKVLSAGFKSDDCFVRIISRSLNQYLEFLSIKLIFSEEVANVFKTTLSVPADPETKEALATMVLEHGIVQDLSPLKFVHRTFAEYLVARFVTNFLRDFLRDHDNLDDLPPHFQEFLWKSVLAVKCEKYKWTFTHPTLCHFLDFSLKVTVMEKISSHSTKKSSNFLQTHAFLEVLLKMMRFDFQEHLGCASIFFAASRYFDLKGLVLALKNIIWITAQSRTRLAGLFIFTLLADQIEATKFIIEDMDFGPEHWHLIQTYDYDYDKSKLGILHYVFNSSNPFCQESSGYKLKDFIRYLFEKEPNLLKERDSYGRTPLLFFVHSVLPSSRGGWRTGSWEILDMLEFLVSLGADIHDVDENQNTVLHLGCRNYVSPHKSIMARIEGNPVPYLIKDRNYSDVLEFFLRRGCNKEVNCFNSGGQTPLFVCLEVLNFYDSSMNTYSKFYRLTHEDVLCVTNSLLISFRYYGMDLNICDLDDKTIICKAIEKGFTMLILQRLVEFGANILNFGGKGKSAFQVAVEMGGIQLVKYLISVCPSCMYIKDRKGKSLVENQSTKTVKKYLQYKVTGEMSDYISCAHSRI